MKYFWAVYVLISITSVARAQVPATIVSQIHNAPGWLPDHTYLSTRTLPYIRVNSGPGWDAINRSWIPNRPLAAYQLVSDGECASGTTEPAAEGARITDGTCTWRYLSRTDYITITGWANDNLPWKPTRYSYHDITVSGTPLAAYRQERADGCASTIAPTQAGGALPDGCSWRLLANIYYTSGVSHIPTETFAPGVINEATDNMANPYRADLWNDREYLDGVNGEAAVITLANHNDRYNDSITLRYLPGAPAEMNGWPITITTASGESFADTVATAALPLGEYNPRLGVGVHGSNVPAITIYDNNVHIEGLQVESDKAPALGGVDRRSCNHCSAEFSVIEGGVGASSTVSWGAATWFDNDLFIARGPIGLVLDYPGVVLHSTIVNENVLSDSVALETGWNWIFGGQIVADVAIYGFAHAAASTASCTDPANWRCVSWFGKNNFTDAPEGDSGTLSRSWLNLNKTAQIYTLPGTSYSASASAAFRKWPGDYRLSSRSPLVGAGAAYGPFNTCPKKSPCFMTRDSTDIIGTARPSVTGWDIGAWQTPGSSLPARPRRSVE